MNSRLVERQNYARKSIEESEYFFRALIDAVPAAVFTIKDEQILYANTAAALLTGYSVEELKTGDIGSLIHNADREIFLEIIELSRPLFSSPKIPENLPGELRLLTKSGNVIWVNVNVRGIEQKGEEITVVIAEDITDRVSTASMQKKLIQWMVEVQEEERKRLSRELHDQTGQDITTLSLGLKTIEESHLEGEYLSEEIQKLQKITSILGHKIHQIAFELRPTSIDDLGLLQTLQSYTFEWSKENGIPVEFESISADNTHITLNTSINVFRIVQEAFNNILKHARPTRISLIYEQKPEIIKIVIEDDGIGFDSDKTTSASSGTQLGLLGMKERAEIAGGTLTIESDPGKGTTVFLSLPLG